MAEPSAKSEDGLTPDGSTPGHPPMISFVGPSGTGKTTLLEGVIAELSGRGHRIGAVKHDAHRIELDTEGKDSWRLRQAGAASTMLMGRNQLAWFGEDDGGPTLAQVAALVFSECDLVVVEGYRSAGLQAVVVERPDHRDQRWEPPEQDRILLTVLPDEIVRVADVLEQHILAKDA